MYFSKDYEDKKEVEEQYNLLIQNKVNVIKKCNEELRKIKLAKKDKPYDYEYQNYATKRINLLKKVKEYAKKKNNEINYKELIYEENEDLSLCKVCGCMTKSILKEGKIICGKCKNEK